MVQYEIKLMSIRLRKQYEYLNIVVYEKILSALINSSWINIAFIVYINY